MEERSKDRFDEIEEDFRKKCLYTDSDNLYLFGNLFCEDEVVSPEEAVLDKLNPFSSNPNPKGLVFLFE